MVELYSEPGCYTLMEVKLQTGQEVAVKVWAIPHSAAEEFHKFEKVRSPIS
jgi:hypothetical protein